MNSQDENRSQQVKAIFLDALDKAAGPERTSCLDHACGGDPGLRAEVESLLLAHERAGEFLDPAAFSAAIGFDHSPLTEGPGTVIGRYKLLERIGEGGMAVVYMAEQTEPIRRKVALKIIKLGMDTRQVIARFEAERQALALMDHPNIAKVLDAGSTETGRPYFVMELVQGVSITEYCDKNNLSTKDRLTLFLQVCQAVQHAHTKGIIHRDIKPSNVMVTHHDGKPVPKVIDFGIAKATNQRLTEKTLYTRYAHIIGTPAYMSPEQAELSDLEIDARTDIYSLGVLLYELLTGATPFSEEELRKAGYVEMQRVIREQEPVKPSTRIRTAHVAQPPSAGSPSVRHAAYEQVRGDLDWIVMKTLEKDRIRRYETAEILAADIQRHLEHRPVLAHAPSIGYGIRKCLRRHRSHVIAGVATAVVAGLVIVILMAWSRDRLQLVHAERLKHEAILAQARQDFFAWLHHAKALETIEPILDSRHVGPAARLLNDQILEDLHLRINQCTQRIEANPMEAGAYSERARYYDCLHDRAKARADMAMWSAIQRQRAFWNSCFGAASSLKHVVDGLSGYQLVFSAERAASEVPVLSIAFGQKGAFEMKLFEIPMVVVSLLGLGLLAGPQSPPAYADITFGEPVNLEATIPEIDPVHESIDCFSSDGLEMYVQSDRSGGYGSMDTWVFKRASLDDGWGRPENAGPNVNSPKGEGGAYILADGLTLYFNSARSGGKADIYMTTRATKNAPWGPPVNLGSKINSSGADHGPKISADGLELYFQSDRLGGYGYADIYVAKRATPQDPWGEPTNLGPTVNSPYSDTCSFLSADGLVMFFSDHFMESPPRPGGYGGSDIWMTRRASVSSPWQAPANLGPQVNSSIHNFGPCLSPDGSTLYFITARSTDFTTWDNWQVPILPVVDFNGDGRVDANDQDILTAHLGQNCPVCDIAPFAWGNGVVDENDLAVLAEHVGKDANDPTLRAHWTLDEGAGIAAMDMVGGHDALITGTVLWEPEGKIGGALVFDGETNLMRAVTPVLDPAAGPFSVIAWVKGEAPSRVIVSQYGVADWLYVTDSGMLATDLKPAATNAEPLTSGGYVLDGQWHRVALVWDGLNRLLYMDGVEVASETQSSPASSNNQLQIGCGRTPVAATLWTGLIDDVRVYSRTVHP